MKIALAIVVLSLASLAAGVQQQPFNIVDAKGGIDGVVLRAGTRSSLAGVVVNLKAADRPFVGELDLPAEDSSDPIDRYTGPVLRTDSKGRFTFHDIDPGRYFLTADQPEFLDFFKKRGTTVHLSWVPPQRGDQQTLRQALRQSQIQLELIPITEMGEWGP